MVHTSLPSRSVAVEIEAIGCSFPIKRDLLGVLIFILNECDDATRRAIILDIIKVSEIDRDKSIGELIEDVDCILHEDHGQIILIRLEVIRILNIIKRVNFRLLLFKYFLFILLNRELYVESAALQLEELHEYRL